MAEKLPRELVRVGVLAVVAAWLLHPFATGLRYGAGDALWYADVLADYVIQLRRGIFPIFAGQTEFAFNGAVYPLRVAPMYQHLAGLLDFATGRTHGYFALQHMTVIVCGVAGIYVSYFTLRRMAPERPWSAAGFAILYLSCPGLLATIYTQDLYMTWMTVPLAPLAAYGIWRTFQADDVTSQFWLAAPLAALWWAHAPIALWFCLIAAASQGVRLLCLNRGWAPARRAALGAALFAVLAQYPFVSAAEVQAPGQPSALTEAMAHPELVAVHVRDAFPAALLPLSEGARALGDIQLGYALWAVLLCCAAGALTRRSADLLVLLSGAALLLFLLFPIPGLSPFLWAHMPGQVIRITYYWPMQRFYLIAAALLAAAGQIAFGRFAGLGARARTLWVWVLVGGCAWSLLESRQFLRAASERIASRDDSERTYRSENRILTNNSYGLFPGLPPYFSNGVLYPRGQVHLLSPATGRELPVPEGRVIESGPLVGTVDENPGVLRLGATVHLRPGQRYALEFTFRPANLQGVLQFSGNTLFREYALPSSGEALAFGSGPGNGRSVTLWTSNPGGDDISMRFIPTAAGAKPEDFEQFGSFRLLEMVPSRDPAEIVSLLRLSAHTRSEVPALLETPRMFMPGYRATVDGKPAEVLRSAAGLVSIGVPAGRHDVALRFQGPWLLRASYGAALAAWAAILVLTLLAALRAVGSARS